MATKNISLPAELEEFIDAKVASGQYAHASEVVRDGIRLLMQQEADKLEWLRNAIAAGIDSANHGRLIPAEKILGEVRKRGRELLANRRKAG